MREVCVFCRQAQAWDKMAQRTPYYPVGTAICVDCLDSLIKKQEKRQWDTYMWWSKLKSQIKAVEDRKHYVEHIVEVGEFTI